MFQTRLKKSYHYKDSSLHKYQKTQPIGIPRPTHQHKINSTFLKTTNARVVGKN